MISLEQVKLLESKVSRTIDYVKKVNEENTALREKLDSYQVRIEELEVLVNKFKDEQSRIEEGILSALNRLNQFEDAVEGKLSAESKPLTESKPVMESKLDEEEKAPEPMEEPEAILEEAILEEEEERPAFNESEESGELDIF